MFFSLRLSLGVVLFVTIAFLNQAKAFTWQCDQDRSLSKVTPSRLKKTNLAAFRKTYDKLYDAQDESIKRFSEKLSDPDKGREWYFESILGKASHSELIKTKVAVEYSATAIYLSEDKERNSDQEFYTDVYKDDVLKKIYYLKKGRIIAILKENDDDFSLTRFGTDCKIKEIVSFSSNDSRSDSYLNFKANKDECSAGKKVDIDDPDMLVKFNTTCEGFRPRPATPPPSESNGGARGAR